MKCPFCQQEYIITKDDSCFGQHRCVCRNPNCEFDGWHFPIKLVSELIRTRKALDVAVKAMESAEYFRLEHCMCCGHDPQKDEVYIKLKKALEQITALEQKDK